jgi:hypothetical protein
MRYVLTFLLLTFSISLAIGQPDPIAPQTADPRTVESKDNFIAYAPVTGLTGNSYVVVYNWLSADKCKNKLIVIENIDDTDSLDYSITVAGLNVGATLIPLTIGVTEQTEIEVGDGAIAELEFDDPVSRVVVSAKSSAPGSPADMIVQASCFRQ